MNDSTYLNFLDKWQATMPALIVVAIALSILTYLFFKVKCAKLKTPKEKFDLMSEKKVKFLLKSHVFIAIALFLFTNMIGHSDVQVNNVWFFTRLFVAFSVGFLYAYVAHMVLKFHYPRRLESKLKKLRYAPRINPENGNQMKLLSETEEDAYLDEGMQAEERVFSIDYDVWIDPPTGYTTIEKYKGHLSALECDRCGLQTLRLKKETIEKAATKEEDGELIKEYECSYCNRIKRKNVVLSHKIKEPDVSQLTRGSTLSHDDEIAVIKIEMHSINGDIKEFDCQNIRQAKEFLNEFDLEKLVEEEDIL